MVRAMVFMSHRSRVRTPQGVVYSADLSEVGVTCHLTPCGTSWVAHSHQLLTGRMYTYIHLYMDTCVYIFTCGDDPGGWQQQLRSMHGAHGVVASHPLRMRKALGSNPSVSICPLNRLQTGNMVSIAYSWVLRARHRRISTWIGVQ